MTRFRASRYSLLTAVAAVSLSVIPASSQILIAKEDVPKAQAQLAKGSDTRGSDKGSAAEAVKNINGDAPSKTDQSEKSEGKSSDKSSEKSSNKAADKAHQTAVDAANRVNQLPGSKVDSKDLEPVTQTEIKGWHPIKRALQPIVNLEAMSVKLEQDIMKLEGPISALQPPMINLQHKMTSVDESMVKMQSQLNTVQSQMAGVRADLKTMRGEIADLKGPILSIQKPLQSVSSPLESLQKQLDLVLLSIFIAAVGVVVGTPVAAILIYRYRGKLFPSKNNSSTGGTGTPRAKEAALR